MVVGEPEISTEDLEKFSELLTNSMGLYYSKSKLKNLHDKLIRLCKRLGFDDPSSCLKFLVKTPFSKNLVAALAKELTVGETYFFRHESSYRALQEVVLPDLIQKQKYLKIWSAACCSGEEPYSIAILLDQLISDKENWEVRIKGTDINPDFLKKGRAGNYNEWSFRETTSETKASYFTYVNGHYRLRRHIREMVEFEELNLIEDPYPVNLDLILCNHVLIYFSQRNIREVIDRMVCSLKEGGWLICSSIEVPFVEHEQLSPERIGNIVFFKKVAAKAIVPKPVEVVLPEIKQIEPLIVETEELEIPLDDKPAIIEEIQSCANRGDLMKARELCEKEIEKVKVAPQLYYLYAAILLELDYTDEAIDSLKKALFLDPGFVIAHFTLGSALLLKNEKKGAKRAFRNTLELLKQYQEDQILPGTDDMTAERLRFIAESIGDQ